MQLVIRQLFDNFQSFGGESEAIEREGISHSAVNLGGSAIICFFCYAMSLSRILHEKQGETCIIRGGRRFSGRAFVQALQGAIEIWKIAISPVNARKCVQCLAA